MLGFVSPEMFAELVSHLIVTNYRYKDTTWIIWQNSIASIEQNNSEVIAI